MAVVGIIIMVGSFYGGLQYGKQIRASGFIAQGNLRAMGTGGGRRGGMGTGGDAISGEILSKDDKSITIKIRDGGSKILFLSESTQVVKPVPGVVSDLFVGSQIM